MTKPPKRKPAGATVHQVMFQIGPSCNSIGVFSNLREASVYCQDLASVATHLMTCGAAEYPEAMKVYDAVSNALLEKKLHTKVRQAPGGGEIWIDLIKGTKLLQPAAFTITTCRIDEPLTADEEDDDIDTIVHSGPERPQ